MELILHDEELIPAANFQLVAKQIRSNFAFGSALNAASLGIPEYDQFFRENFEWATVEWHCQWVPTEPEQDVEDYSIADESVAFARDNGIAVRGHALTWAKPVFVPSWLPDLSNEQMLIQLNQRIVNATSHFRNRLASWDVCNELLHFRFFRDRLGDQIVPEMFAMARGNDPDTPLFTNEYDILPFADHPRTQQYVELIRGLLDSGAPIDGIGLQGHFWSGNVSPTNMELAIDQLGTLGLPIVVSEYDSLNSSDDEKAKQLETAYRYLFSRPEVNGIIMWGFWANAHWRGADAALIESDWNVNAAGQKYLQLRDEWSTQTAGTTNEDGQYSFRGFQGVYQVDVVNEDTNTTSIHLVTVPRRDDGLQRTELSIPETANVLSIYGSDSDDSIEVDLNDLSSIQIGQKRVPVPAMTNLESIRIHGQAGNDQLLIKGQTSSQPSRYFLRTNQLTGNNLNISIEFSDFEKVVTRSCSPTDQIRIYDSDDNDLFISETYRSTMMTPHVMLIAEEFPIAVGDAGPGFDMATLYDNDGNDLMFSDLRYTRVKQGINNRRASGFECNSIVAQTGADQLTVNARIGDKQYHISPGHLNIDTIQKMFWFENVPSIKLRGRKGTVETLNITDSPADDRLTIRENYVRFEDYATFLFVATDFNRVIATASRSGGDVASIRDTASNESLVADAESAMLVGKSVQHLVSGFDEVQAVGNQGGENNATIGTINFDLRFFGNWIFP